MFMSADGSLPDAREYRSLDRRHRQIEATSKHWATIVDKTAPRTRAQIEDLDIGTTDWSFVIAWMNC